MSAIVAIRHVTCICLFTLLIFAFASIVFVLVFMMLFICLFIS